MGNYSAFDSSTNTASTTVPMFVITGATTVRPHLFDLVVGSNATPADNYAQFSLRRTSARGTSSASFTPTILDPADPAALCTFDTGWSTNPTITANSDLLQISLNQRSTFRWIASPDAPIYIPATSGAGLAFMSVATSGAVSWNFTAMWEE